MPGWVTTTRFSRSISRTRFIRVRAIVRPPSAVYRAIDRGPSGSYDSGMRLNWALPRAALLAVALLLTLATSFELALDARSRLSGPEPLGGRPATVGASPGDSAVAQTVMPRQGAVAPAVDAIHPGSVNATSMNLTAEYAATINLNFGTRAFKVNELIVVTNTSGK